MRNKEKRILYFVEGETEETLISCLKKEPYSYIRKGKIKIFNIVNKKLSLHELSEIENSKALCVFVFDTDTKNVDMLDENIKRLKMIQDIEIVFLLQVKNFEDEITRSTNISNIDNMFNTKTKEEFKHKFISYKNIERKLQKIEFNPDKLRINKEMAEPFSKYLEYFDKSKIKNE